MKFYNRENELKLLDNILNLSKENSKMTVITGRRRVKKIGVRSLLFTYSKDLKSKVLKDCFETGNYSSVSKKYGIWPTRVYGWIRREKNLLNLAGINNCQT
jgi:AAA+ ATPase superfamily predicted ATPase